MHYGSSERDNYPSNLVGVNMKKSDREDVIARIENEGFDYCFCHYSDFNEVKDAPFHKLPENYVKAAEELKNYLGVA